MVMTRMMTIMMTMVMTRMVITVDDNNDDEVIEKTTKRDDKVIERSIPSQDGREKNSTRQVFSILKNLFYIKGSCPMLDSSFPLITHQNSDKGKNWTALPLPFTTLTQFFLCEEVKLFATISFSKPCNAMNAMQYLVQSLFLGFENISS